MTLRDGAKHIDLRYSEDGNSITLFKEIFDGGHQELCGLEELVLDYTAHIKYNGIDVYLPSSCELFQTDGIYIDGIPLQNFQLDLPLLTLRGKIGVNRVNDFTFELSVEKEKWIIPTIPREMAAELICGLVVVVNPKKYKPSSHKELIKKYK